MKQGMIECTLLLAVLMLSVGETRAHDNRNKPSPTLQPKNTAANDQQPPINASDQPVPAPMSVAETESSAHTESFPTLHPLVVHFPIGLIILAAVMQIVSLVVFRHELNWTVIFLTAFGALGAYLSSSVFHPHTAGLSENAQRLLTDHELYADWTLWLAVIGLGAKSVSSFVLKRRWWSETFVTVALILSAVAVSIAGHHGAELVHKEGVGPKGKFLEMHD